MSSICRSCRRPLTGITRRLILTAVGTHARHELEQHALVEQAFAPRS